MTQKVHALVEWGVSGNPCIAELYFNDITDEQLITKIVGTIKDRNRLVVEHFSETDLKDIVKNIVNKSDEGCTFICLGTAYAIQRNIEISF